MPASVVPHPVTVLLLASIARLEMVTLEVLITETTATNPRVLVFSEVGCTNARPTPFSLIPIRVSGLVMVSCSG
jgi:hypothetical protein